MPWTFTGLYKEELDKQLATKDGSKIEAKRAVARRVVQMAIEGDIQAIKELSNRIDGMPIQPTAQVPDDQLDNLLHIYRPEKNKT